MRKKTVYPKCSINSATGTSDQMLAAFEDKLSDLEMGIDSATNTTGIMSTFEDEEFDDYDDDLVIY